MTKMEMQDQLMEMEALLKTAIVTMQYQHELLVAAGLDPKTGKPVEKAVGLILPNGR